MRKLGCNNWKIGSGEALSKKIMLEIFKKKNDGFIVSTGMSTWSEISNNYQFIKRKKDGNFAILQCTTEYPSNFKNIGLNVIKQMKKKFKCKIGLSDHSGSVFPSLAALSIGAQVIELHICDSKKGHGPDNSSSITFNDLNFIVRARDAFFIMNKNPVNKNILSFTQKKNRKIFSKSIALKNNLKKGEIIKSFNLTLKKPGTGLSEKMLKKIINKKAKKNLSSKRILRINDFE